MKIAVETGAVGRRLDVWLSKHLEGISRSRIRKLIDSECILVDGKPATAHRKVCPGMTVDVTIPEPAAVELVAENIPLKVLYEDRELIAVNKPPGMVVHPGAGNSRGTLVNALLYHCTDLKGIGDELRPGIVHRLDKDTSGVLVAAKTDNAMTSLSAQFKEGAVRKSYVAIVAGVPSPPEGSVEAPIGRSRSDRKKMAAVKPGGEQDKIAGSSRRSLTFYRVVQDLGDAALVRLFPRTGRTHQIRVHMKHIGHHVLGDRQYRSRRQNPDLDMEIPRQMLHAEALTISHPVSKEAVTFRAPPPEDFEQILAALKSRS